MNKAEFKSSVKILTDHLIAKYDKHVNQGIISSYSIGDTITMSNGVAYLDMIITKKVPIEFVSICVQLSLPID